MRSSDKAVEVIGAKDDSSKASGGNYETANDASMSVHPLPTENSLHN